MQGLFIDLLRALEFSNEQFNDGFWSECWGLAPSGNISFCEADTFGISQPQTLAGFSIYQVKVVRYTLLMRQHCMDGVKSSFDKLL